MSKSKESAKSVLSELIDRKANAVDSVELASAIIQAFDGPDAFARELRLEFQQAPPGSTVRQRILTLVSHVIGKATDVRPPVDEVAAMTDEELKQAISELIAEAEAVANDG